MKELKDMSEVQREWFWKYFEMSDEEIASPPMSREEPYARAMVVGIGRSQNWPRADEIAGMIMDGHGGA